MTDKQQIAIYTERNFDMSLFPVPASRLRKWWEEDSKTKNHARFCLPMLMANSYGFYILSPADISFYWDGSAGSNVEFITSNESSHTGVTNHSAHGTFTIQAQIVPRTPVGVFTLIKPLPNIRLPFQPLEGLIETWWSVANFGIVTFATRPGEYIIKRGDPIAQMIFIGSSIHDYELVHAGYVDELRERKEFMEKRNAYTDKQLDYMKGLHMDGTKEDMHFSKFKNTSTNNISIDI